MIRYSAPGKIILFGEHAVVYGEPAIAIAIDKRFRCEISKSGQNRTTINGLIFDPEKQNYLNCAMEKLGIDEELEIHTSSELISGAGMGSSAAVTVASIACLRGLTDDIDKKNIAKMAFEVEYEVQGNASPIDTSTSTQGGGIILSPTKNSGFLWSIKKGETTWNIHKSDIPKLNLVLGNTGVHSPTGKLVAKIKEFYKRSFFARDIVNQVGLIVQRGHEALKNEDLVEVGRLMDQNQHLLSCLGVSHPKLDALIDAAREHSYGAKLSGVGGGGVMIALTDEPEETSKAIEEAGGQAYILPSTNKGLKLE